MSAVGWFEVGARYQRRQDEMPSVEYNCTELFMLPYLKLKIEVSSPKLEF